MLEHVVRLYYIEVVMSNKKRTNEKKYQNCKNKLILQSKKIYYRYQLYDFSNQPIPEVRVQLKTHFQELFHRYLICTFL